METLFTPLVDGNHFLLDVTNPESASKDRFEATSAARRASENQIAFLTFAGAPIQYADGTPDGVTIRLYAKAGGEQTYTWRNGAREHGYIGSEKDLRHIEATVCMRLRDYNKTHASLSWILRGGAHTGSHNPRASCIGLQVPYAGLEASAFKELDHPDYDFIKLDRKFDYAIKENEWVAIKAVSLLEKDCTRNFLYLDADPLASSGQLSNNFRLYSEWIDRDGIPTGKYTTAALWAGWITTFRVDGWKSMDVAQFSVYEVASSAPV